MFDRISNT